MVHTSKELATFFKRKGFIYPSSEIYGGVAGLYDYGHLGTLVKRKFENQWRHYFLRGNNFELDCAQIMHEKVFEASGHLDNFADPAAITATGKFMRADHLIKKETGQFCEGCSPEELLAMINKHGLKLFGEPVVEVKIIPLMFSVQMGAGHQAYLRPETAQSSFVNFKLQHELLRNKLPMGLAVVGRAFRNEISPRHLTLRLRELTQAELQIFFNPNDFTLDVPGVKLRVVLADARDAVQDVLATDLGVPKFYAYHLAMIQDFYVNHLGISKEKFRFFELNDSEKAFYNKIHFDFEVDLAEHGWTEVGGLHYRGDHDLSGHQKVSGQSMTVDDGAGNKFIPHVLELSFGVDRTVYSLLDCAYDNNERGNVVMHLAQEVVPFATAVFPLLKNKPELVAKAQEVHALIGGCYDEGGSIGRRYARADEMGVRWCITIDFDTLENDTVTLRDRETMQQERVVISQLNSHINK